MKPYRFSGDRQTNVRYQTKYAHLFEKEERVLDLGCGEGGFLELLQGRGVRGVGVDVFQDAVTKGREKGLDIRCVDALPFVRSTTERFDGVFIAHVIEHLRPVEAEELLQGCYHILRPRGRLIVITPNTLDIEVMTQRFWSDPTHVWPYPARLLEALVREAGFEVLSVGDDPDTLPDTRGVGLRTKVRYWLNKMRFGEYFGRGDTVAIARRTA